MEFARKGSLQALVLLTGLVLLFFSPRMFSQTANEGRPKAVFQESALDIGKIQQGDKLEFTFTVKNEGTRDLVLKRVAPS